MVLQKYTFHGEGYFKKNQQNKRGYQ